MGLPKQDKLKHLIQNWPNGIVATSTWLDKLGISKQLRFKYCKNNWIEVLDRGAFKKYSDTVEWNGAIFAIQDTKHFL